MSKYVSKACPLIQQGCKPGSCRVAVGTKGLPACEATLRFENGGWQRLIASAHLSRPENYLSIYQSGCNFSCRKCHSWYFTKAAKGEWATPADILEAAKAYDAQVTLTEPRERATAWHAHDTCHCCGACVLTGERSSRCPGVLDPRQVILSPQGFGPARNIVAFTGGDLTCRPEFYARCAELIKAETRLWFLLETNGYGLTSGHLDVYRASGVDAFWLDIKAEDPARHRWLTGCDNHRILRLPEEMRKRDFVLEVLSLYIPGVVEAEELGRIGRLLAAVDPHIPFTVLAFFPEYQMRDTRPPTVEEMVRAYEEVKRAGLIQVRLGNLGVFARGADALRFLEERVESCAY